MESGGKPGHICISQSTKDLLEGLETTNYTLDEHKTIEIKSLGMEVKSYFVGSNLLKESSKEESILDESQTL